MASGGSRSIPTCTASTFTARTGTAACPPASSTISPRFIENDGSKARVRNAVCACCSVCPN